MICNVKSICKTFDHETNDSYVFSSSNSSINCEERIIVNKNSGQASGSVEICD